MKSLTGKVISGSSWMLSIRVAERGLRFLRIIIVARLIAPNEFGMFGIALIFLGAFDVLTRTGFDDALIQKRGKVEGYAHTSYWIQVGRGIVISVLVYFAAPFAAAFFNVDAATPVIRTLCFVELIKGFRSVGYVLLQREMKFNRVAIYFVTGLIMDFSVTIALAWHLRSVWALVFGVISGELGRTLISFILHPYKPAFSFNYQRAKELYQFGIWLFMAGIVSYLAMYADKIAVGRLLGAEALGIYQMAYMLANLPTTEVSKIAGRVLKPAYAARQVDLKRLAIAFNRSYATLMMIILPAAAGIILLGGDALPFLLGKEWMRASAILPILAVGGLLRGMMSPGSALFVGTGNTRMVFKAQSVAALTLMLGIYPGYYLGGLSGVACASVISLLLTSLVTFNYMSRIVGSLWNMVSMIRPVFLSALIMIVCLYLLIRFAVSQPSSMSIAALISAGIVIYGLSIVLIGKKSLLFAIKGESAI